MSGGMQIALQTFQADRRRTVRRQAMRLEKKKLATIAGLVLVLTIIVLATTNRASQGIFPVRVNGKYGFIDHSGKLKLQPQFDNAGEFKNGRAPVQMGAAWGYVDSTGKLVVNPQ